MEKILEFEILRKIAERKNRTVKLVDMVFYDGLLKGDRIGLRTSLHDAEFVEILAHEIAHVYLHAERGNMIDNPDPEAEESADRAGKMLLDAIEVQNSMLSDRLKRYLESNHNLAAENKRLKELLRQNHIKA